MRLHELTIHVPDLEASRRFYCAVLGFNELDPQSTGKLAVQVGASRLVFQLALDGSHPRYHFAFDVPSNRFDAAEDWLRERGGAVAGPSGERRFHFDNWNADSVYFLDLHGNVLELIARYGKPTRSPADSEHRPPEDRPFSAVEILGITEIGISADSVVDTVAALQSRLPGVPVYDGEGSDQFTAVGDKEGLLIVVHRGRIWFPNTGIPAEHVPLEVLVETENGLRSRLSAPPYPIAVYPQV